MTMYGQGWKREARTTPTAEQAQALLGSIRHAPVVLAARVVRDKQRTAPSLATLDFTARQNQYLSLVRDTFALTDAALLPPTRPLPAVSPSSPNSPNASLAAHSNAVGLEVVAH